MFVRFALLALVAAAAAVPANRPVPAQISEEEYGNPWFSFPPFSSLFAPFYKLFPAFADIGPRITTDDSKFQIVMNGLKNYKKEDLTVKTKGSFIFIEGSNEVKDGQLDLLASHFSHIYTLPEQARSSDVTAKYYNDGTLVVVAPFTEGSEKTKQEDRVVPIVETGVPYLEDGDQPNKGDRPDKVDKPNKGDKPEKGDKPPKGDKPNAVDQPDKVDNPEKGDTPNKVDKPDVVDQPDKEDKDSGETTVASAAALEDRKEPMSPEFATEKDNVIPHGNEAITP